MNNTEVEISPGPAPSDRRMLMMLGILCALIGADAYISRFIVRNGLGSEGNVFLKAWVTEPAFFFIKLGSAAAASYVLWSLYKRNPRPVQLLTAVFVGLYSLIVLWNALVAFAALTS